MKTLGWVLAGGAALYLADKMGLLNGVIPQIGTTTTTTSTGTTAGAGTPISTGGTSTSTTTNASQNNTTTNINTLPLNQLFQKVYTMASADPNFQVQGAGLVGSAFHWFTTLVYFVPTANAINLGAAFPGVDLSQPMAAVTFWAGVAPYLQQMGMSGMGVIAHYVNPYTQGPRNVHTKRYGANLTPTGMETYMVYKGSA